MWMLLFPGQRGNHVMGRESYPHNMMLLPSCLTVDAVFIRSWASPFFHHTHIIYVIPTYIMQWDHADTILRRCFSYQSTVNPVRIQEILRKENYIQILDENLKESAEKF